MIAYDTPPYPAGGVHPSHNDITAQHYPERSKKAEHMTSLTRDFPVCNTLLNCTWWVLVTRTTSGVVVHPSQGEGGRETVYTNASLTSAIILAPLLKLGAPGFRAADFPPHEHVQTYT